MRNGRNPIFARGGGVKSHLGGLATSGLARPARGGALEGRLESVQELRYRAKTLYWAEIDNITLVAGALRDLLIRSPPDSIAVQFHACLTCALISDHDDGVGHEAVDARLEVYSLWVSAMTLLALAEAHDMSHWAFQHLRDEEEAAVILEVTFPPA